jgi:hypothetical protein
MFKRSNRSFIRQTRSGDRALSNARSRVPTRRARRDLDPRSISRTVSRAGLARSSVLLLLVLLLAAIVVVLFAVVRGAEQGSAPLPAPSAGGSPPARDPMPGATEPHATRSVAKIDPATQNHPAATQVEAVPAEGGQGPGVIRGQITALPGTKLPLAWTLIVEPHPFLQGRERAVTRRIEFTNGEQEFKVEGLPLAGYSVRAQAPGLNDVSCSALLVPGSANVFVNPQFRPAGFIDGNVIDASGNPAQGVLVVITSEPGHARASARTDAHGDYLIPNVTDGAYSLSIGPPDAPLLKPDALSFKAPSLRFPVRQLPETGTLRVTTLDESGRALPDTEVTGISNSGGALRVKTDGRGTAAVRYLLPGRYRLEAKTEDGRRAGEWVEVGLKQETVAELRLK